MTEITREMLNERITELEHESTRLRKDRDIYKDAFKDATMANTVSAKNLAEQEAKTVEYRAAWIKAQRERDEYAKRIRSYTGTHMVHQGHDLDPGCREHLIGDCRLAAGATE